jgi:hypothetical protein
MMLNQGFSERDRGVQGFRHMRAAPADIALSSGFLILVQMAIGRGFSRNGTETLRHKVIAIPFPNK